MSDYPTIETGAYTWHPVINLATLLRDMRGALKEQNGLSKRSLAGLENAKKSVELARQRRELIMPELIRLRAAGLSNNKIGIELGMSKQTVSNWFREWKNEGKS